MKAILLPATALLLAGPLLAQTQAAIPYYFDTFEGSSWHFKPYNDSNMRFQQIFSAKEINIPKGKAILEIGFRNEGRFVGTFVARSYPNVTMRLQVNATVTGANATTNFANNLGTGAVTIFTGKLDIKAHTSGQTFAIGTPILHKLLRPVVYNGGNIVFDMEVNDPANTNTTRAYNCDRQFGSTTAGFASFIGVSCPSGRNGMTITTTNQRPGGQVSIRGTSTSATSGAGLVWFGATLLSTPIDLSKVGWGAGCRLHTIPLILAPVTIANSAFPNVTLPIPNDQKFVGFNVYAQYAVLDQSAPGNLTFSLCGMWNIWSANAHAIEGTYIYWTGSGDVTKQAAANSGPWRNRADTMVVLHT